MVEGISDSSVTKVQLIVDDPCAIMSICIPSRFRNRSDSKSLFFTNQRNGGLFSGNLHRSKTLQFIDRALHVF